MSEWPWQIPESWVWARISELTTVVGGGTPRTNEPASWDGGTIPWITPADLSGYASMRVARGSRNISERGLARSGARMMPAGTVLLSSRAPVGYVAIAANPLSTNQGFKSFPPTGGVLPEYLYYYLKGNRDILLQLASGTTFLEVSGKRAAQIPVPVPPYSEQQRIVTAVEEHLSRLDAAVAELSRVRAQLPRYRAAVLKAACEGRLVPTEAALAKREDRTFESACQLLERIGSGREIRHRARVRDVPQVASGSVRAKNGELPEGWSWACWDQVGVSQNGRAFPSREYASSGVRLLRPGNLDASGSLCWTPSNTRCLPESWARDFPQFVVRGGELVMNLTAQSLKDEFLGRVCITATDERALLNQRLARLTPRIVSPRFLLWMFKSGVFRRFVDELNTGSLIQHMFTSQLASFTFPLPPLAEQVRIVTEIERRLSLVDSIDGSIQSTIAKADHLRQSVVIRAFQGKLVPQDPTDEPAEKLLERIQADRPSVSPARTGKRARARRNA